MASKSIIDGIYNDKLCLGCGLCESVCGMDSVKMKLQDNGFFRPEVLKINKEKEKIINSICPGINVVNDLKFNKSQRIWGKIEKTFSGFSTDAEVRTIASSGGIVSGIAIYMLEKKIVDAVLQVGGNNDDYERNTLKISRNRAEVIQCASSRYAPALIFDKILEILLNNTDTFCFIGKPCDISALKNFLTAYPQHIDRFKLTVSIMCAGMPSFNGTKALIENFSPKKPIKDLVYRGNGWPGFFSFEDNNGNKYQKSYNDSWGSTLNRHLNFRCKICPDGIGLQADIAIGDAWETKDGYPDFTEREGQSLIIARTKAGLDILQEAEDSGRMILTTLYEHKIALMQPYQFERRKRVGARVVAFYLGKQRFLNFRNIHLWRNLRDVNLTVLFREFGGTLRRVIS